jgi:opacity protein-like surface antigen
MTRPLRAVRAALTTTTLLAAGAAAAHAQAADGASAGARRWSIGAVAGASIPTGTLGDVVATGFNVAGQVEYRRPASPLAVRLEVDYHRFGLKDELRELFFEAGGAVNANLNVLGGAVNAVYTFPVTTPVRPYVLGGLGVYRLSGSFDVSGFEGELDEESDSGSATRLGANVGAGIELPLSGITAFAEVRYLTIRASEAANLVPLRVGVRF